MLDAANKTYIFILAFLASLLFFSNVDLSAQTAPADAPAGSSLEQRVEQRKKERAITLDEKASDRIVDRCVNAQGKIRSIRGTYTGASNNRTNVYKDVDAKLWIIIGSLKLIDKDTFKLEQQRLDLLKQINAFDNSAAQLRQTLDDLAAMNCKADPVGFKALLDTSRLYNAQVRSSFITIRSQIIDHIKPTLSEYADELKIKASSE